MVCNWGLILSIRSLFTSSQIKNIESEVYLDDLKRTEILKKTEFWINFLENNKFDYSSLQKIDMSGISPIIFDKAGNKFSIDFNENKLNYGKIKSSLKKELISRALGSGRYGLKILDLSAGLGIDAVFLAQLGYSVVALERNPLIYLALNEAISKTSMLDLKFVFADGLNYLQNQKFVADVIYFDPMFPEKSKSALPRQEMVFFRSLVGQDMDAIQVLQMAIKVPNIKRVVVKRPLKAPALLKPQSVVSGKLIRFDLYSGFKP